MPKQSLTARWIDSVESPAQGQIDYFDSKTSGLGLRVSQGGRKTWFVMYRYSGRLRRFTLGTYPALGLADARDLAKAALHQAAKGSDPAAEKQSSRIAPTFRVLAEQYIEIYAKQRKRSWAEDARILEHDLLPAWGSSKAHDIKRRDVIALLDEKAKQAPIQANRVLALARKIFNWAISRDLLEVNPCAQVKPPAEENRRDRVLSQEEIQAFWHRLDSAAMTEVIRVILKLQLITAQRKGEIVGAEWSEFDLVTGWWTIPSEKSKNGLAHRVPLSALALEVLASVRRLSGESRWLFPARRGDAHILDTSIDHALRKNLSLLGLAPFTPHDLRRTAASHMTGMGVPRLVVSKILNHVESGITAVYDRHSYDKEKREALEAWSGKLQQIIQGEVGNDMPPSISVITGRAPGQVPAD